MIVLDSAKVENWRIKWVVGVAHLPVAAIWEEILTIPIFQKLGQINN